MRDDREGLAEGSSSPVGARVALGHDFFNQWGGAERVFMAFRDIYPKSDVFCVTYDESIVEAKLGFKPKASFIQRLPGVKRFYKALFWLMPTAVESLDLRGYKLLVTDCSNYIKGCRTDRDALHICYLHTPTRYVTFEAQYYKETSPRILHPVMPLILAYLKRKDARMMSRPSFVVANSKTTASRMEEYYGRKPDAVLFPPVDSDCFYYDSDDAREDYFLVVGRLVPYKRTDLAIEAVRRMGGRIKVVGSGPEFEKLQSLAGPEVEFIPNADDEQLRQLYARCRALVFPQVEDAGIIPLEAMACGSPVVALGQGGALESVVAGETGGFFDRQEVELLANALKAALERDWVRERIRAHALAFNVDSFKSRFRSLVDEHVKSNSDGVGQ